MPTETLRAALARLREEIAASADADPEALARLGELASQIEAELDLEASLTDPGSLAVELEEAVGGFEASHPNLAAILHNMLSVLGSMGV